jgi:hypothetical protein
MATQQLADTLGIGWHLVPNYDFYTCNKCGGTNLRSGWYVWQYQRPDGSLEFDLDGAEFADTDWSWYCDDCDDNTTVTETYEWLPKGKPKEETLCGNALSAAATSWP